MADNGRQIGFGSILKISTGTTTTSSTDVLNKTIGALINFGGFTNAVPAVDVTLIGDAAACVEPGTPAAGPGTITVGYKQTDAGIKNVLAMNANRTKGNLWLVFASTNLADEKIKGYISDVGISTIAKDGHIQRTISVQPTSAIGWYTT